jgi:rubrerythrin
MTNKDDRALKMFSTALEMEEKGKAFYEKAKSTCHNKLGREIFRTLMEDELVHIKRIKTIYKSLKGAQTWSDEWKSLKIKHEDLSKIFRAMAIKHGKNIKAETTDLEAFDIGIDFELRSITFYEEQLGKATDPQEKEFVNLMIGEERNHHLTLADMKYYLTDPASWFIENERAGLDGA